MVNSRLVNIFFDLVKIDSPTGEENEVAQFIINYISKHQLVDIVKQDKFGNVYLAKEGQGKPLFLTAHLDTVEPGRNIKPKVKNGYIVSDGTTILGADDKAAIAGILEILEVLKTSKKEHRPLEIVLTKSEEIGNLGAINFNYSLLKAKIGFCFDSSNPVGTIVTSSPFYERFDLLLIGKEAHASKPEEALNVLFIFKKILNQIQLGRLDKETLLNIGVVEGGRVRNTVLGQLLLKGEIRSMTSERLDLHKQTFLNIIEQEARTLGATYEVEFVRENPGYVLNKGQLREVESVINKCQLPVNKVVSWGVSDANIFNDKGLTCINLGYGGEFVHTISERIKTDSLEALSKLMLGLVTKA